MIHTRSPLLKNVVVGAFGTTRPAQRSTLRTWQANPASSSQSTTIERIDRARQALENHKAGTNWDEPIDWSVTAAAPTPFAALAKLELATVEATHPSVVTKKAVVKKAQPKISQPKRAKPKKLKKPDTAPMSASAPIDLDEPLIDLRQRPKMIVLEEPKLKRIWPQA